MTRKLSRDGRRLRVTEPARMREQMVELECPWCAGSLAMDGECVEFDCATCAIVVEFAPDPIVEFVAVAA